MQTSPPTTDPADGFHWAEYAHAGDAKCPDPEHLGYSAHQWVQTPDDADEWPGVVCGGCMQPLEPVESGGDDGDGEDVTPLPEPTPGPETKPSPTTEEGTS